MSPRIRHLAALLGLLATALLVAGCGDDDEGGAEPASVAIGISGSGDSFTVPDGIEAGLTELTFTNDSKRPQDMQLVRIEGSHPRDDVAEVLGAASNGKPIPDWFLAAGGVGGILPGQSRSVTQILQPGSYYAVGTSGRLVLTGFQVGGETSRLALPDEDASVRAFEYGFEADGLQAGTNTILFENTGAQLHHIVAARINQGATIEDVERFVSTPQGSGKPPADLDNSEATAVLEGGSSQLVDLNLKTGRYALLCFISDRQGGPPHVAKGMVSEVEVE